MAVLGLHHCALAFSSCRKGGSSLLWCRVSHRCGFSCCGAPTIGTWTCGPRAYLPHGMWNSPLLGIEPVSPTWAGRFPTTGPPENSCPSFPPPLIYLFLIKGQLQYWDDFCHTSTWISYSYTYVPTTVENF